MANDPNTIKNNFVKFTYGTAAGLATYKPQVGEVIFLDSGKEGTLEIALCVSVNADGFGVYKYITDESLLGDFSLLSESVFKKDGSVAATQDFNLGSHKITQLAAGVDDTDAVNKKQLTDSIGTVQSSINNLSDTYVKRNGETPMLAAFDAGNYKIVKLAEGTDDTDAVNVQQLKAAIKVGIEEVGTVMKFLGAVSARPESAVVKVNNIDITAVAGDVVVVAITGEGAEANGAGEEYVYDGTKWILIGDENTISTLSVNLEKLSADLNNGNYSLKWNTF